MKGIMILSVLAVLAISLGVASVYGQAPPLNIMIQSGATDPVCIENETCIIPTDIQVHQGDTVTFSALDSPQPPYSLRGGEAGTGWDGDLFTGFIRVDDPKTHTYNELGFFPYHDPTYTHIEGSIEVVPPQVLTNAELTVIVRDQQEQIDLLNVQLFALLDRLVVVEVLHFGNEGIHLVPDLNARLIALEEFHSGNTQAATMTDIDVLDERVIILEDLHFFGNNAIDRSNTQQAEQFHSESLVVVTSSTTG